MYTHLFVLTIKLLILAYLIYLSILLFRHGYCLNGGAIALKCTKCWAPPQSQTSSFLDSIRVEECFEYLRFKCLEYREFKTWALSPWESVCHLSDAPVTRYAHFFEIKELFLLNDVYNLLIQCYRALFDRKQDLIKN